MRRWFQRWRSPIATAFWEAVFGFAALQQSDRRQWPLMRIIGLLFMVFGVPALGAGIRKWAPIPGIEALYDWAFWLYVALVYLVFFLFVSNVRHHRRQLDEAQKQPVLPLTLAVERSGGRIARYYRFRVCNPTDNPITKVYAKYRRYRVINRPSWRFWTKLPFDGMNLPWDDPKGGTTTIADIGARSSEDLHFGVESVRSFQHYGPNKKLTHSLNGGTYEFILEIGSKTSGAPISRRVRVEFSKQTEFAVEIIPPTPDTESGSPQATQ